MGSGSTAPRYLQASKESGCRVERARDMVGCRAQRPAFLPLFPVADLDPDVVPPLGRAVHGLALAAHQGVLPLQRVHAADGHIAVAQLN